jgi:hypothetical protein
MTTLYDLTVPILINALKAEQHLLSKAEAFASEKGTDIEELLKARLSDDMWPLSQQIVISALHSSLTVQKLTGKTPNKVNFGPGTCTFFLVSCLLHTDRQAHLHTHTASLSLLYYKRDSMSSYGLVLVSHQDDVIPKSR